MNPRKTNSKPNGDQIGDLIRFVEDDLTFNQPWTPATTFDRELTQKLHDMVPDADLVHLQQCAIRRNAALRHAREKKKHLSHQHFVEVRALLRSVPAQPATRLTILSFLYSAEAYFHFKFSDKGVAERFLWRSLKIDRTLQDRYGIDPIDIHRLQTASNFCRMWKGGGDFKRALPVLLDAARYAAGNEAAWPFPECATRRRIGRSSEIWRAMTHQLLGELFVGLAEAQDRVEAGEIARFVDQACQSADEILPDFIRLPLEAKRAFFQDDPGAFLSRARVALDAGYAENPLVYFLLLRDVGVAVRADSPGQADQIMTLVRQGSGRFQRVPAVLSRH